jgi:polyribonucleotide nucleotidyltransferase
VSVFKKSFAYGPHTVTIETGEMARQANGAVLVTMDATVVLVTAVAAKKAVPGRDFFPLTVNYQEKTYAAGRIPGGFFRREGRPSERETLTSRLIDRPIRPLFPDGFINEVQVVATVLSLNPEVPADVPSLLGASAALCIAGVPFKGPIGAARVGYHNGQYLLNPLRADLVSSQLDLVVAGTAQAVLMVESEASGLSEEVMLGAVVYGHEQMQVAIKAIRELAAEAGKPKWDWKPEADNSPLADAVSKSSEAALEKAYLITEKQQRYARIGEIKAEAVASLASGESPQFKSDQIGDEFFRLESRIVRNRILAGQPRIDGRDHTTVRPITVKVGTLPRTHGSALFTRGETQALVTATLGTTDDSQRLETFEGEQRKKFMLHYNFPPFSVGETGRMTGVGRREVGHGALAERAISAVLPSETESPYSMRVVSDILESNGSSSMASVCGASLALMDAGIPLKSSVAGIAMGLVKEGDDYAILTDIAGAEDHYGDMDFKVAGTRNGITALQMDIKIGGITGQIMREAMEQARRGRLFLLDTMDAILAGPRTEKSKFAPQIRTLQIPTDKIRDLIGPGGKTIRGIIEATQVKIDVDDTGKVNVASSDEEGLKKALQMINDLTAVPEVGKVYLGKVVRLAEFGAFVEIFPGTDGLLHISEIAEHRVREVKDELHEGDQVMVKVLGVEGNRIKLSRKAVLKEQRQKLGLPDPNAGDMAASGEGSERPERSERPPRFERGDRGDRGDRSDRGPRPPRPAPVPVEDRQPSSNASTIMIEGGEDFEEDDGPPVEEGEEINYNRADGVPVTTSGERRPAGPSGSGGPGGGPGGQRRRRRRGRRPGGPGGGPGAGPGNRG